VEHRTLGRSDVEVSVLGIGLAALGRPGYITLGHGKDFAEDSSVEGMRSNAWSVLDAAHVRGITYFDAARSYGLGEEFLASWLDQRAIGECDAVVGSKWGYVYVAEWQVEADQHEVKIHSRANLDNQYEESLGILGSRLALYQIHSATLDSGVLERTDVLSKLAEMRDSGLIVGASTSGPAQGATIERMLEIEIDGRLLFGVVEATWNLLEPSAGGSLAQAHDAGLGVIVKEAVANGRLTARDREVADRIKPTTQEWTVDAVAIAAAIRQPWASVVLSGAANTQQLQSNVGSLDVPDAVVDELEPVAEDPDRYWTTRSGLRWQ